jgi:hypothetical protein
LTEAALFSGGFREGIFCSKKPRNGGDDNLSEISFKKSLRFLDLREVLAQEQLKSTISEAGWAASTDCRPSCSWITKFLPPGGPLKRRVEINLNNHDD